MQFYYISFVLKLDIRDGETFGRYFIIQYSFHYPVFYVFQYKVENFAEILAGILLNL